MPELQVICIDSLNSNIVGEHYFTFCLYKISIGKIMILNFYMNCN